MRFADSGCRYRGRTNADAEHRVLRRLPAAGGGAAAAAGGSAPGGTAAGAEYGRPAAGGHLSRGVGRLVDRCPAGSWLKP